MHLASFIGFTYWIRICLRFKLEREGSKLLDRNGFPNQKCRV